MIPYGRQEVTQDDIDAVIEVLKSDFLTQGPVVPRFERAVAEYCGAEHAVAVNSGTSALHIACLALGLGPGDWLWTSPISFVASANCALYCGARVDFVDVDPSTGCMSVEALSAKLEQAAHSNRLPKIVVPVHLGGLPCDMVAMRELAQTYGFRIIEDACHAIGGRYRDEPVGSCAFSDITVFSFHPVKGITSAEGGMAVTNVAPLANQMRLLRSHGITRDEESMVRPSDGPWYYEQLDLGFNYRMTDVHAALGMSQLTRLDAYIERRHQLADRYDALLSALPVGVPRRDEGSYSGLHLYIVRLRLTEISASHRAVFEHMRDCGIGVNLHYIPIHLQPFYRERGYQPNDFPQAEAYYQEAISLPLYPSLGQEQQDLVAAALREALLQ